MSIDLVQYYRETLSGYLDVLEKILPDLQENKKEAWETLERTIHTLKGSGTTFGFPEVSQAARNVEKASPEQRAKKVKNLIQVLQNLTQHNHTTKKQILVIEKNAQLYDNLYQALSAKGRELDWAICGKQAQKMVKKTSYSLIILDLMLSDMDGRLLLSELRSYPETRMVPIMVISPRTSEAVRDECLFSGADDFLEKPLNYKYLQSLVTARLRRSVEIKNLTPTDLLTGFLTRRGFEESFGWVQNLFSRQEDHLSLGLLDLDNFKKINDTFGHVAGDKVIQAFAEIMHKALRKSDVAGRVGGDEFGFLFPSTTPENAQKAIQKTLEIFHQKEFLSDQGERFKCSFSCGIVSILPGATLEETLIQADRLLYLAKDAGGGMVLTQEAQKQPPKKIIVIVEDDKALGDYMTHYLKSLGFSVLHFVNGQEAWEGLQRNIPSLIILDALMPGMDGFGLLKKLKDHITLSRVPKIMVTSLGEEQHILQGFSLGVDDYIIKPFSIHPFLARVNRLIEKVR